MTKQEKELIEKIEKEMPKFDGDKTQIEKKIAMYIYLFLGKNKVFEEKYYLGNTSMKKEVVHEANYDIRMVEDSKNVDKDPIIEKRKIVCLTLANLYKRLLNDFGLNAKTIRTEENSAAVCEGDTHVDVLVTFSNGEQIIVNPQKDLHNIQTGCMTQYFGEKYETDWTSKKYMDFEEVFELHKACGYVNSKEDYMENRISDLENKVVGLTPDKILQEIIKDDGINNYQKDIGYIEMYKFYVRLISQTAHQYAQNGINYFNCYRLIPGENGKQQREYSMCIYSIYKEKIEAYLYSNTDKTFKKTELETFKKLQEQGLHLGKNEQEKGMKVLKRNLRNLNNVKER